MHMCLTVPDNHLARYVARIFFISLGIALSAPRLVEAQPARVTFSIDASSNSPISPYIYGTNQSNWSGSAKYLTFTRLGGNRWSAYNWENNASNAGEDYFSQNDDYLGGGDTPGEAVRARVASAMAHRAGVVVTVPMMGYVAADKNGDGDVNQTPNYLQNRFVLSSPRKNAPFSSSPNRGDTHVYQDEFVAWLEGIFPRLPNSPTALFYCLDNEPDLWASTHPRIHPEATQYSEMFTRTRQYAAAIKDVVPTALVFGPVSYGWYGYVRLQGAPDAADRDFLDTYLDDLKSAEQENGRRLVDVLDLHWYPEAKGGGINISGQDRTRPVVAARVSAPRSLYDSSYVEDSWITRDWLNGPVNLLPRLQQKIATHYPGTRLAFTEYNYGGGSDISGAIAEADVLGSFGAAGVFAAALWELADDERFIYAGLNAYRNFDGHGAAFGDRSHSARSSDIKRASIYASSFSSGINQMVLVAINRSQQTVLGTFKLNNFGPIRRFKSYRVSGNSPALRAASTSMRRISSGFVYSLPPMSVTTMTLR